MRMMTTATYISTVKANRTIELPSGIPVGSKVAIVLLPSEADSAIRQQRFQSVIDTIRSAIASNFVAPDISDKQLKTLIVEARQSTNI